LIGTPLKWKIRPEPKRGGAKDAERQREKPDLKISANPQRHLRFCISSVWQPKRMADNFSLMRCQDCPEPFRDNRFSTNFIWLALS
jgi:hypothetical protein